MTSRTRHNHAIAKAKKAGEPVQTTNTASVDSRQQTSALRLKRPDEIPPDFPFPSSNEKWEDAILIPGDGKDWRGRMLHPPRIYTVSQSHLTVYTHPAFEGPLYRIELNNLVGVSSYKATLHGELQFYGVGDQSSRLHYGTFRHHYIDPFLRTLYRLWLPVPANDSSPTIPSPTKLMDTRCYAAIHAELADEEHLLQLCFLPSRPVSMPHWFFRHTELVAARVLVLTNRRLILAVEGYSERQQEHGVRIQSCVASRLQKILIRRGHDNQFFQFVFEPPLIWKLWVSEEEEEAISVLLKELRARVQAD